MNRKINLEKREKLKKYALGAIFLLTLGFFSRFEAIDNKMRENKYEVKYDEKGFINEINNNGKIFKYEKGRLL